MSLPHLPFDPSSCLIDGEWRAASLDGTLPLVNPSDGTKLCEIANGKEADIDSAVKSARNAFDGDWGRTPAA